MCSLVIEGWHCWASVPQVFGSDHLSGERGLGHDLQRVQKGGRLRLAVLLVAGRLQWRWFVFFQNRHDGVSPSLADADTSPHAAHGPAAGLECSGSASDPGLR